MKELSRSSRIITAIFGVLTLIPLLFMLWNLIAVGFNLTSGIALAIPLIWLLIAVVVFAEKKKLFFTIGLAVWLISIPLMGCILFLMTFGPYIHSTSPWKYNIQRSYIVVSCQGTTPDFPAHLPKDIRNYEFDFAPHIMQGAGHCSARFETSDDTIKEYESEYAPRAIYTLPISDFKDHHSTNVDKVSDKAETWSDTDKSLKVWMDEDFWGSTDATVYVLSAVHNSNHPHSSAVIISKDHTKVQFTQLG